ncbi:MAG: Rab family GTPase [Promethearchaeota archaeon]
MHKKNNEEEDTFFNSLKSASTKRRMQEFLKKNIHDQIQELDYHLGYNKDRIKELGFERERIKRRINSNLDPSFIDRYGIGFKIEKKSEWKLESERLNQKILEQKRFENIELSSKLKEIDIEIEKLSKSVQFLNDEIQMRKEILLENVENEHYLNEKPKYTPSILYDKEPPQVTDVEKIRRKKGKRKKKVSFITLKICILGEKGVGISSWLQNCSGMYEVESYTLRNFGFGVKSIKLEDKTFKLQLWFLNAYRLFKKRFHRDLKLFETLIRGCNGVFLVYDITNIESLSRIPEWIHSIREICGNIPIVLLGNKSDLENLREISKEQDIEFVKKYEISGRYEISIKTGKNVNLPFQKISEIYFQKFLETKGE